MLYEKLSQLVDTNRNYAGYDLHLNIVDKIFNGGCGALNLFRFYENEKVIVINKTIFTKTDKRKLSEFCRDFHIEDWEWKLVKFDYPDWYFGKLSISMCA